MNHFTNTQHVCLIILILFVCIYICSLCAVAFDDGAWYRASSEDLWSIATQKKSTEGLYNYLYNSGYIEDGITYNNFDYICVLTQQLSSMTTNVTPELALATIAVESRFDVDAKNQSARGLMQLIPLYHSSRMEQFVENDHQIDLDDFYDPRLNVMTGLDYLDYILSETDNDIAYTLMWYNQGPISASKDYLDNLKVSSYAKNIMSLAHTIKTYL